MGQNTKIEWCHHTWNPWRGCTKISDGCKFCYADRVSKRNPRTLGVWGPNGTRVVASEAAWHEVVKWNRLADDPRVSKTSDQRLLLVSIVAHSGGTFA